MNDRDASPERPRCRRRDHLPCGEWRYGKLHGTVHEAKSGYQSKGYLYRNGVNRKLWYKLFHASSYSSREETLAAAEQHQLKQNKKHGVGKNIWRPVTPNHAEVFFDTETDCSDTMIVDREWWLSIMADKNVWVYAAMDRFYARMTGKKEVHRVINNTPPGLDTDHIDRDTLHECTSNLRSVTRSINGSNAKKSKKNTTGHTGISVTPSGNNFYWTVRVHRKGYRTPTAYFRIPKDADPMDIPQYVVDENLRLKGLFDNRNGLDPE